MLTQKPLTPVQEQQWHEGCGGEYLTTGITLVSSPPWYQHKCSQCNNIFDFRVAYPRVAYVPSD